MRSEGQHFKWLLENIFFKPFKKKIKNELTTPLFWRIIIPHVMSAVAEMI